MPVEDLGARLRARRTERGSTLAQVAQAAGLSVPYVANLERGRGNPTLEVIESLAEAVDMPVAALVASAQDGHAPPAPPGLDDFLATTRFRREVRYLSQATGATRAETRQQLVAALAASAAGARRPLADLDWHRLLDALVLVYDPAR